MRKTALLAAVVAILAVFALPVCSEIIKPRAYDISISDTGDKLAVKSYRGPTGKVRIVTRDGHERPTTWRFAVLSGDPGKFSARSGEMVVPPGKYKSLVVAVLVPRAAGSKDVTFTIRNTKPIEVVANQTLEVDLGGPVNLEIQPASEVVKVSRGKSVNIPLRFLFADGEMGGSATAPDAEITITDAQGKTIRTGKSGFG